jgi:hypothetical protein
MDVCRRGACSVEAAGVLIDAAALFRLRASECSVFVAAVCFALLWCVLCCAVLCCAVLCCAVLCCAVLCCAVLCCAVQADRDQALTDRDAVVSRLTAQLVGAASSCSFARPLRMPLCVRLWCCCG